MNMRFSQRLGFSQTTKLAQRESIDDDLRNSLWSLLTIHYWNQYRGPGDQFYSTVNTVAGSNIQGLIETIWLDYFKLPVDSVDEYWANCLQYMRDYYFKAAWFEVYDFIEFVASSAHERLRPAFTVQCNANLERENSAYRFVGGVIAEITSAEEIEEVERALTVVDQFAGIRAHLESAIALLSDRHSPNFRNSIKESISAVESLAKQLAKDKSATLGAVLTEHERAGRLHPALKKAFSALYGYTSDAEGIRHALMEDSNLTKSEARFMLVCCSAFINYVIDSVATK